VLSRIHGDDRPTAGQLATKHARLHNLGSGSVAERDWLQGAVKWLGR
jgi:hypothetical protein